MSPTPPSRSVRVVPGEIDSQAVSTLLVIPSGSQPAWPPFRRVAESIANRGRQLPVHAHEHEEVLTYVTEGFASYGLEGGPTDSIPQHSARLLTAPSRASHRVSPAEGAIIRWFNLVVDLPETVTGSPQLQSAGPGVPYVEMDTVRIRPLVGPRATMRSVAGLECEEMVFVQESTTFPRVGEDRRAILYALAGEGSVDQQTVSAGEAALIEGQTAVGVRGARGFRAIFASAPKVEGN